MHERSLGPDSRWAGYLAFLPPREYVPVFWSPAELARLAGSDLEGRIPMDAEAMASDFSSDLAPLPGRHPGRLRADGWTLGAFRAAASWVGSRAFGVDPRHGDALVPLADVFNHKARAARPAPPSSSGSPALPLSIGGCALHRERAVS